MYALTSEVIISEPIIYYLLLIGQNISGNDIYLLKYRCIKNQHWSIRYINIKKYIH